MAQRQDAVLGTLIKVPLRDVWAGEASDFTPWLCMEGNLALLGQTVGLTFEAVQREVPVGDYRLDILATHVGSDEKVVIENQFGATDHSHLGQLMTYAAGVGADASGAKTVIWIAERFNDSHRSALDWLNKITDPSIRFFGVELELWKIGESVPAPRFSLVSKPNDWQKRVTQQTSALSERDQFCLEYWEAFKSFAIQQNCLFRLQTPRPSHYLLASLGKTGMYLSFVVTRRDEWIGCELILNDSDPAALWEALTHHRTTIDRAISGIVWEQLENRRSMKLYCHQHEIPADRSKWPAQQQWLLTMGNRFHQTFEPIAKLLR